MEMETLDQSLVEHSRDLIEKVRRHPFLIQIADGTIPDPSFLRWFEQNGLWVSEFERFLCFLSARLPGQCAGLSWTL